MGRSQVARNRAARGRGRGGRGEGGRGVGGGRGGGGRSSSSGSRRRGGGADPSKLGNNDFRYERGFSGTSDAASDDLYDGLLDDINFMPSGVGGMGEYHGDSHHAVAGGEEEEELADATLLSAAGGGDRRGGADDWMSIDVKALDDCLKKIPIRERLRLPYHIGLHLEDAYGGGAGRARRKTLAELREESKAVAPAAATAGDEPRVRVIASGDRKSEEEEVFRTEAKEANEPRDSTRQLGDDASDAGDDGSDAAADDEDDDDEEEGEDLEAWLDDMIA